jgi:pSer/pThr/pTyr-binding forkhead associated (FHA) protein
MQDWIAIKNSMDRDQFRERYPHPFLLLVTDYSSDEIEFSTAVVDLRDEGTVEDEPQVLPVTKTGANPFRDRILIGRSANCDIVVAHPSVSKLHAELRPKTPNRALLVDKDSSNGTEVNAKRLTPRKPMPLRSGDRVRVGGTTLLFLGPEALYDML